MKNKITVPLSGSLKAEVMIRVKPLVRYGEIEIIDEGYIEEQLSVLMYDLSKLITEYSQQKEETQ